MKNTWIIATFSLLANTAFAFTDNFNFYGGLSGGLGYNSADTNTTFSIANFNLDDDNSIISASQLPYEGGLNHFSGAARAQLGAGMRFEHLYLGIEALGQYSNGDFDTTTGSFDFIGLNPETPDSYTDFSTELEMNDFEFALDLKPGVFFSKQTMLYARIGIAFNELTISEYVNYDLVNHLAQVQTANTESKDLVAARFGLGLEHHLYDRFTVLIDYTYTNYGSIETSSHANALADIGIPLYFNLNSETEMTEINKQLFMIGFNYYL